MTITTIELDIPNIPKGEEKSFRRGVADGLLDKDVHKEDAVHKAAYEAGFNVGGIFKKKIAERHENNDIANNVENL